MNTYGMRTAAELENIEYCEEEIARAAARFDRALVKLNLTRFGRIPMSEAIEAEFHAADQALKNQKMGYPVMKVFGIDFDSDGGALTLREKEVSERPVDGGVHTRTHADGWTITGEVHEDWVTWVNEFKAEHPLFGKVWGNFEERVFADSEEGFENFYENHTPEAWDYCDI